MNFAANMLGLDNAATPLGLKAMQELQELNPDKETATNAQIMFLVLNTSGLTIIPISIMIYRAQLGAANPSDIFLPILLTTYHRHAGGADRGGARPADQPARPGHPGVPGRRHGTGRRLALVFHGATAGTRAGDLQRRGQRHALRRDLVVHPHGHVQADQRLRRVHRGSQGRLCGRDPDHSLPGGHSCRHRRVPRVRRARLTWSRASAMHSRRSDFAPIGFLRCQQR